LVLALALPLALAGCNLGVALPQVGGAASPVTEVNVAEPQDLRLEPWVDGLEAPWSLVFLEPGRALVSERPGRIRLILADRLGPSPYLSFDVRSGTEGDVLGGFLGLFASGEGGLLGLAVHPRFAAGEPFIYAMTTYEHDRGVSNRVVRIRDRGEHGVLDRVIFDGIPGWAFHNGGRLAFGPDGML
jgi:glucose/arabinose dehydrogenase